MKILLWLWIYILKRSSKEGRYIAAFMKQREIWLLRLRAIIMWKDLYINLILDISQTVAMLLRFSLMVSISVRILKLKDKSSMNIVYNEGQNETLKQRKRKESTSCNIFKRFFVFICTLHYCLYIMESIMA